MTRRIERINSLIRQEISELLRREVKDPRLGSFTIVTEVSTSLDLSFAKVFVSQVGSNRDRQTIIDALTAASGFFRRELTKRLKIRHVPELAFYWDDSIERGARLLDIMDKLNVDASSHRHFDRP
jgi:ribosome-binding factor A